MIDSPQPLAEWTPSPDMPVFRGHFPGNPLLPGAMLIDWAMSAYGDHLANTKAGGSGGADGVTAAPMAVRQARFPAPARPGIPLHLETQPARRGRTRLKVVATPAHGERHVVLDLLLEGQHTDPEATQ
ncbi:hypothetical protein GM160_05510 [Guyparkeria halophila]|uniref:ApeI dehydratase-like domain-containing protein n=1 Tax=Guyparkeria halophila TaxID=47960 RepID=A0A6I6CVA2_9GAMM|nr:hypothetical protein [Guyparkeria halophila]QGT78396.1 hypothetical protein GM160_05510 [Guyparkeria halophila]